MFQLAIRNYLKPCVRLNNSTLIRSITTSSDVKNSDVMNKKNNEGSSLENNSSANKLHQLRLKRANRVYSTLHNSASVKNVMSIFATKEECREFMSIFPDVVRDLTEKVKQYDDKYIPKWFARSLQYNVPNGKKNRALSTVIAYKMLVPESELTPENLRLCQILGWCIEMLQSVFLVSDDIIDGSTTRRGGKCWYLVEDVGMEAINDVILIENGIYYLLKKYFSDKPCYLQLIELFHEITLTTIVGQFLDFNSSKMTVNDFSMDLYKKIVDNKTGYYTFYFPVAAAMCMAGFTDPEQYRQTKTILLEMGQYYQIQDDVLDCFGDPEITGKIGTDIQDNKCNWLAVMCMQRASPIQKKIMEECYGHSDPEKVAKIKQLYEDLGLPNTFVLFEEESYSMIKTHIQQTSRGVPHGIFTRMLDKIYKRDA